MRCALRFYISYIHPRWLPHCKYGLVAWFQKDGSQPEFQTLRKAYWKPEERLTIFGVGSQAGEGVVWGLKLPLQWDCILARHSYLYNRLSDCWYTRLSERATKSGLWIKLWSWVKDEGRSSKLVQLFSIFVILKTKPAEICAAFICKSVPPCFFPGSLAWAWQSHNECGLFGFWLWWCFYCSFVSLFYIFRKVERFKMWGKR